MLADIVGGDPSLDPVRHFAVHDELPAPDPGVVDSARHRLAARLAMATGPNPGEVPGDLIGDLHAVNAVLDAAHAGAERPADVLDFGAGLVLLCNMRLYLDRLEADLLDGTLQVGLGWDVIAAIIGIPAREAQDRHLLLRARPGPQ